MNIEMIQKVYIAQMEEHGNKQWAIDTLQYMIYDDPQSKYHTLNDNDKEVIDTYFRVLKHL